MFKKIKDTILSQSNVLKPLKKSKKSAFTLYDNEHFGAFHLFPKEIVLLIFSFLPEVDSQSLACVNSYFNGLVNELKIFQEQINRANEEFKQYYADRDVCFKLPTIPLKKRDNFLKDNPAEIFLTLQQEKELWEFYKEHLIAKDECDRIFYLAIGLGCFGTVKAFSECISKTTEPFTVGLAAQFNRGIILDYLFSIEHLHWETTYFDTTPMLLAAERGYLAIEKKLWRYICSKKGIDFLDDKMKWLLSLFLSLDEHIVDLEVEQLSKLTEHPKRCVYINSVGRSPLYVALINDRIDVVNFFYGLIKKISGSLLVKVKILLLAQIIKKNHDRIEVLIPSILNSVSHDHLVQVEKANLLSYAIITNNQSAFITLWEYFEEKKMLPPFVTTKESTYALFEVALLYCHIPIFKFLKERKYYSPDFAIVDFVIVEKINFTSGLIIFLEDNNIKFKNELFNQQIINSLNKAVTKNDIEEVRFFLEYSQKNEIKVEIESDNFFYNFEFHVSHALLSLLKNYNVPIKAARYFSYIPLKNLLDLNDLSICVYLHKYLSLSNRITLHEFLYIINQTALDIFNGDSIDFDSFVDRVIQYYDAIGGSLSLLLDKVYIVYTSMGIDQLVSFFKAIVSYYARKKQDILQENALVFFEIAELIRREDLKEFFIQHMIISVEENINEVQQIELQQEQELKAEEPKAEEPKAEEPKAEIEEKQEEEINQESKEEIKEEIKVPQIDMVDLLKKAIDKEIESLSKRLFSESKVIHCKAILRDAMEILQKTTWNVEQRALYLALMMLSAFNERRFYSIFSTPPEPRSYITLYQKTSQFFVGKTDELKLLSNYRDAHTLTRKAQDIGGIMSDEAYKKELYASIDQFPIIDSVKLLTVRKQQEQQDVKRNQILLHSRRMF